MTTSSGSLSLSLSLHSLKILSFWDRKSVIGLKKSSPAALSARPHDKDSNTTLRHRYIGQASVCVICLCACLCVCVSSCMSIRCSPGALRGSGAAWSAERAPGIMGAAGWGGGGWWRWFSAAGTLPDDCWEIHHFSPLKTRHLPRLTTADSAPPRPRCSVHTEPRWDHCVQRMERGGETVQMSWELWQLM